MNMLVKLALCAAAFGATAVPAAAQAINIRSTADSKSAAQIARITAMSDSYPQHWTTSVNQGCSNVEIGPYAGVSPDPTNPMNPQNSTSDQWGQSTTIVTGTIYNLCQGQGGTGP